MPRKKDITKEEIAKQFMLPERQSKIDSLLRQEGQAYCVCRSSDSSRFMIACDACEEWYHGDCIGITEKEAKLIKQYYCERCQEEDSTLVTRWRMKREKDDLPYVQADNKKYKKRKEHVEIKNDKKQKKCGDCTGCYRTEDCSQCDVCTKKNKYNSSLNKAKCKQRVCVKSLGGIRKKRRDSSSERENSNDEHLKTSFPRQCYGPKCVNSARYGSKYCSEECGLSLATARILQVLPQRLQEWALTSSIAEGTNICELDQVRKQQIEVRHILSELDNRHYELDVIVQRAKNAVIDPKQEDCEDDAEVSMFCVTCGHEIHSRTAIRHMEKCFNKYESQASFGSIFKTRIEGYNMFCDFYNAINKTYCKRLKVLCPEHCKDPKIGEHEVCGCPLVKNVFKVTGDFCRAPKKSCVKHYVWEKIRRAQIDLERVRQWLKIDELIEKERQIRVAMTNRASVLALMLHSTYNHEVMEELQQSTKGQDVSSNQDLNFQKKILQKTKYNDYSSLEEINVIEDES